MEHQRWIAEHERWKREEAERRKAEALKASKDELHGIIEAWAAATRLEQFFADAEHRAAGLPDDPIRFGVLPA